MTSSAPDGLRIGHVHLRVADIDRSLAFWRDLIGLTVTARYGARAVFLSAGGYHHHIALNTWDSAEGTAPPAGHTGLYHVALLYPDRSSLGSTVARLETNGIALTGAADHGVSEAVYLDDPDGNGVELYHDRPRTDWPQNPDGSLRIVNAPLDVEALIAAAAGP